MNKETSIYLDAVRFIAALAVFFSHVGARIYSGGFLWQANSAGTPAVVIFFVLSGFVIGYVSGRRETSGSAYFVARAARLYSVVIPTLLLTAGLDWAGAYADPAAYEHVAQMIGPGAWNVPGALVFMHMVWGGGARVFAGSDRPYWSLGYEVAYYALFGLWFYQRGIIRIAGCLAIAALAGPHILLLFPVWLTGFAAYRALEWNNLSRRGGWTAFLGSLAGMVLYFIFSKTSNNLPDHRGWEIAQDYLLAVLFAINLIGFHRVSGQFQRLAQFLGCQIKWLAGATFTLYLLHVPILLFIRSVSPWPVESWQFRAVLVGAPLCTIFFVAQFTERKKHIWRARFQSILRLRSPATGQVEN